MAEKGVDMAKVFNYQKTLPLAQTAEDLVDKLDSLTMCLKQIDEKYLVGNQGFEERHDSIFDQLKENLETARELTDTLKRENWRINRREMSVNLRIGELEEYKSHLKRDMTDMNQTVEVLSMRVVQLENALCEAQELQESTEAENTDLKRHLLEAEQKLNDTLTKEANQKDETTAVHIQRQDSMLHKLYQETLDKLEILSLENHRLKDIIRDKEVEDSRISETLKCSSNDKAIQNKNNSEKSFEQENIV